MAKNILTKFVVSAMLISPVMAFAAEKNIGQLLTDWTRWATSLINFLLVLATLVFLWGIIKYVSAGGDAAKVKEARSYILWGIIGLAVMGSVWVVVGLLQREVVGTEGTGDIPKYEEPQIF